MPVHYCLSRFSKVFLHPWPLAFLNLTSVLHSNFYIHTSQCWAYLWPLLCPSTLPTFPVLYFRQTKCSSVDTICASTCHLDACQTLLAWVYQKLAKDTRRLSGFPMYFTHIWKSGRYILIFFPEAPDRAVESLLERVPEVFGDPSKWQISN